MKNLFSRVFIAFISAQIFILGSLFTALAVGYERSRTLWEGSKLSRVTDFARKVLTNGAPPTETAPVVDPLFIFDTGGALVYSNRGQGRRRPFDPASLVPVKNDQGRLIGYLNASPRRFLDDPDNTVFFITMQTALFLGLGASLAGALVFSYFFSRSLARPARLLALRLDRMAEGDLASPVAADGPKEIASIARSAERLGRELAAEKLSRARFSADLAHDLRTPLAALRAQLEGMRDGVLEASPERLTGNLRELERLEQMTDNLAELMRLEESGYALGKTVFAVREIFGDLERTFETGVRNRRLTLTTEDNGLEIKADRALIERALANLLSNAVRHADGGGTIRLSARHTPNGIILSVMNSGAPVPPGELPHVFDRLFRGEYARSSPGSGLGLTIARQIAELHGGTIAMESTEKNGTTVSITLPDRP